MIRALNPEAKIGFIGAKVAVEPQESLEACPVLDFVCRNEYEFTIQELANGADWSTIKGLSYRGPDGGIVHNPEREILTDMDKLPSVLPLYKQLKTENYFGGYLKHPYMSWYTGRGCKSRCTFCLWPQTIGGHKYRYKSIEKVVEEVKYVQKEFPEIKEIFFDDDTLTDNHDRVEELARALGPLGVTWSCNAKANVPRKTLEVMRANGLRLLLVGYESGNQKILHNIKKGLLVEVAKRFARDCHELGILVHGTFILGLPGETRETIQETLAFAKEVNPRTLQVSLAAPYPGTFLYRQAKENGWFASDVDLLTDDGTQIAPLNYPHLGHTEIFELGGGVLPEILFPPLQDRRDRGRDADLAPDAGAAAARGRGILPVPQEPRRHDRLLSLRRLILTADDFGAATEVNEAVERAHKEGVLTAASLMVAGRAAADAVARARTMPSLRVGLHLVLVEGKPVLPARAVPDLVDANGFFRNDMARAGAAMFFRPKVRRQLESEIEAQFEAFVATGLKLDHVNAHKHFHLHPTIAALMIKRARAHGVKGARVPLEPQNVLRRIEPHRAGSTVMLTAPFARLLQIRFRRAGITAPDRVFGLAWSGAMTGTRLKGLIENLPEGLTEIYLHPATGPYPGSAPAYAYAEELQALTDPDMPGMIARRDIRLGGFCDFPVL